MDTKSVLFKRAMLAAAVSAAIGLTACGGGGGGGDSTTFAGTTSGKAAKGIIQNGKVTAVELDASGVAVPGFTAVDTLTDVNGDYTLVIGEEYAGGPILLTIAPNDDPAGPTTLMKCDVLPECDVDGPLSDEVPPVDYGEWIVNPDFEMQAILASAVSGQEVSTQITPFTDMAASRVLNDPDGVTVTASSVNDAISEVNQIVGVNIMNVEPVDITDPDAVAAASGDDLVYATFAAGMGDLLFSNDEGLIGGLEDLAAAFADGDIDAEDAFAITDLTGAVTDQLTQLDAFTGDNVDEAIDDIDTAITVIVSTTDVDGTYNPEPADSANLTEVEQAKALVSEFRTLVTSLEDPANAFGDDLELAADVIDLNSEALIEITGDVLDAVYDEIGIRFREDRLALGTFAVPITDSLGTEIGSVTVVLADNSGLSISITDNGPISEVDVDLDITSSLPADNIINGTPFESDGETLSLSGLVENDEVSLSVDTVDLVYSMSASETVTPELDNPLNLDIGETADATGLTLSGGGIILTDKINATSFTGSANIEMVELTANADDPDSPNTISLSEISLDGVFANADDRLEAVVGLTINNAASFDTIALLEHEAELWVTDSQAGDVLDAGEHALDEFGITILQSAQYGYWDNQTCFSGLNVDSILTDGCVAGDVVDVAGFILAQYPGATAVNFPSFGYLSDFGTYYSGEVVFPDFETAENFADVTLTAALDLVLSGHPDTSAVITVNRTELEGGDATLVFTHDGHSITVEVDKLDGADATGLVTVSNPDGVEMVLSGLSEADDSIEGILTVNGLQVGTVSETDTGLVLIHYNDGTFESLN